MGKAAVATRKGLFTIDSADARVLNSAFVGEAVTAVLDASQRAVGSA